MKKLIFAIITFLAFTLNGFSQEVKKTTKVVKKTETKAVLKKDGTPDKRFTKKEETKVILEENSKNNIILLPYSKLKENPEQLANYN